MADELKASDLRAGDVLLYRQNSLLARAIRLFDGTEVHHAGLVLGYQRVGEALAQGVIERPLVDSVHGREWVLVRRLKQDLPMDPVLLRARSILAEGHRYAYEQLLLLAFLAITRKLKATPVLRFLLRKILDAAATVLNKLIAGATGSKEPMICSEYVFRCYDEALPPTIDAFSLDINRLPELAAGGSLALASHRGPRGRGVNPDSLLAWSTRAIASSPHALSLPLAAAIANASPAVTERDLEPLIDQYLFEVSGVGQPAALAEVARVSDEDLLASLQGFSASVLRASAGSATATAIASASSSSSATSPLELLSRTAGDFVTPGDLFNTDSLFSVGKIVP